MDLKAIKNQKGQVIVEAMLILVVLISALMLVLDGLRKMEFIQSMTVKPWARISSMVECGTWNPCGITVNGEKWHPNNRIVSFKPE